MNSEEMGMGARPKTLHVSQGGFGLVEILISLALGLVIILGVTQLFSTGSRTMSDIEETGRRIENSVFAAEMLARDLSLIGYWGEADIPDTVGVEVGPPLIRPGEIIESTAAYTENPADFPPVACLGTGKDTFYSGLSSAEEKAFLELAYGMVEFPFMTGTGGALNSEMSTTGACGGGPSPFVSSDFVAIRRASSCALGDTGCEAEISGMFYLQHEGCNTSLAAGDVRLATSQSPSAFDFLTNDCATAASPAPAPIHRYVSRVYYVDTDDYLVRLEYGFDDATDQYVYNTRRLVPGVELMRLQWGIDTNGDGVADEIKAVHSSGNLWSTSDWLNAVSVTVWLVVRSLEEVDPGAAAVTYTIAGDTYSSFDPAYARVVQTRTVDLANVSGRRR